MSSENTYYFNSATELLAAIEKTVKKTEVVLDIGCGLVPISYFYPKLHLMVEPWKEYSDILAYRNAGDKSKIILRMGGLEALRTFADNSVDSIFLLDVIEHLEKEEGQKVIIECERVAREQFVLFTPLGFMPQHMESGEKDGWGLNGTSVQEHRSGWMPEDFGPEYSFYICKNFHSIDFKGEPLEKPFGAFYAVRNFKDKTIAVPQKMTDFVKPLPYEVQYYALFNSRGMRVIRFFRKIAAFFHLIN